MELLELLALRNFDISANAKIIRHQDSEWDIDALVRHGQIEEYQRHQGKHIFNCDYIVSFIGVEGLKAIFLGVYQVLDHDISENHKFSRNYIYKDMVPGSVLYELEEVPGFEDFKNRLVIDWGKSTRSWHQWLKSKPVIEILPVGKIKPFPGFLDFIIYYDELVDMVKHADSNREWHKMLSSVAGVYLIVDTKTGKQYVGSAYGEKGILGRWSTYAHSGHGGNEQLIELLSKSESYKKYFQFSVLRTLPRTLTKNEVIKIEKLYKDKLGTKAFGLNSN